MTPQQQPPQSQPTPQDAAQVSQAVAEAAAAAPTAEQARTDAADAARRTAERVNLEVSEQQIQAIANGVVSAMEQRGAFDTPIEPVDPPPTPAPAAQPAGGEPVAATADPAPRKRTFAERFLGEGA